MNVSKPVYLIETLINAFENRAEPGQAALVRSGPTLFAYRNTIRYDPTLVDLTSNFFVLCTCKIQGLIPCMLHMHLRDTTLRRPCNRNISKDFYH